MNKQASKHENITTGLNLKFRHLWAWDTLMQSTRFRKNENQLLAEKENAPSDAVYRINTRVWQRFEGITLQETKDRLAKIMTAYAPNTTVTVKDDRHWTARPPLTVLDYRLYAEQIEYLLQRCDGLASPMWIDGSAVDGPPSSDESKSK
jgi:hypothetical protein